MHSRTNMSQLNILTMLENRRNTEMDNGRGKHSTAVPVTMKNGERYDHTQKQLKIPIKYLELMELWARRSPQHSQSINTILLKSYS